MEAEFVSVFRLLGWLHTLCCPLNNRDKASLQNVDIFSHNMYSAPREFSHDSNRPIRNLQNDTIILESCLENYEGERTSAVHIKTTLR
jgi:hypothetical protein